MMIARFLQYCSVHTTLRVLRVSLAGILSILIVVGCASEVVSHPVSMVLEKAPASRVVEVTQLTTLTLLTGYQRSLLTGSRWERVGSVPAGEVYKPVGTVFTIEGANRHEAFLVIRDAQVVGFFLPGENAFSALEPAVPIQFKPTK
jgi:hypothetical protein